jgi:hypothetical protein
LDLAAAHFHRGRFLLRHRRSKPDLDAGKASLWEGSEYFRQNGKKIDSIRGINAVLEILRVDVEYKGVERAETVDTLRKLREDVMELRTQRKAVTKDKVITAKIDNVFEQSLSAVMSWLEKAAEIDQKLKQCMDMLRGKSSRSVEEVISIVMKGLQG